MNPKIISIILGIVLLSSVSSFSPVPVDAQTFDYDAEFDFSDDWQKDSDNDGVSDDLDKCPFVPGNVYGSSEGCPPDRSGSSSSEKTSQTRSSNDPELSDDFDIVDEIFKMIDYVLNSFERWF